MTEATEREILQAMRESEVIGNTFKDIEPELPWKDWNVDLAKD